MIRKTIVNSMATTLCGIILILGSVDSVLAEWTIKKDYAGPGWVVVDGEYTIHAPSERAAKKVAKAMNKADKKKSGVMASENGPCADHRSGVLC